MYGTILVKASASWYNTVYINTVYLLYDVFGKINDGDFKWSADVVCCSRRTSMKNDIKCIHDVRHVEKVPCHFAIAMDATEKYDRKSDLTMTL